jgi:hypothetical protein
MAAGSLGGGGEVFGQLKLFKNITIAPQQRLLESVLNRTLFADSGYTIRFNSLDDTETGVDAQLITNLTATGVMSVDEGREYLRNEGIIKNGEADALELVAQLAKLRGLLYQAGVR